MARPQENNSNSKGSNERRMAFRPVEFDASNIEPDASPGEYEAVIDDVIATASKKDGWPQLKVQVKLENLINAEDEEAGKKSEGASITDYWTFIPDRRGNMTKRKMSQCAEQVGVDLDQLPKSIQSESDLKEYVHAFKGKRLTVWVTNREDDSGELRADLNFKQPRSMGGGLEPIDEPEEERKPAARAPAKTASRRR